MLQTESWIEPMASVGAMLVVSMAIVVLTYWSGDILGPWTSVPPVVIEGRGAGTLQPMLWAGGDDAGVRSMPVAATASPSKP
jgi:hypothetical protein